MEKHRIGLIVNPVAGLGGRVGLKGSDGEEIQARARAMGAVPQAQARAQAALLALRSLPEIELLTAPSEMGENVARSCGFSPQVVGRIEAGHTTAHDTQSAARTMKERGVELLLFAGGDGTARDIYQAVGIDLPVLGIPAGVKIHSAAFAVNPAHAGELALLYVQGEVGLHEVEVMDIDEEKVRAGVVSARLYGYLRIPFLRSLVQMGKVPSRGNREALAEIAYAVVQRMQPDTLYFLGPGTTTRAIAEELGIPNTLLGVDVLLGGQLLLADANEQQMLDLLDGRPVRIIVTPIGGQGYLFGRGNQQLSPQVITRVGRENVIVIATSEKLHSLRGRSLLVDTGDPALDKTLSGYMRVITGMQEEAIYQISY